ncbi:hypothetical protein ACB092_02G025300 [Castanea dentata]
MDIKHIVWEAAAAFTKKLSKWRRKQNKKNSKNHCDIVNADINRRTRPWRETQSEIGDYGFGRRSCDTDPRLSVDAAAARYSFDEPRASWDGYLIGARAFPNPNSRQLLPLVSVVEDVNQSRLSFDLTSPPPLGGCGCNGIINHKLVLFWLRGAKQSSSSLVCFVFFFFSRFFFLIVPNL